MTRFDNEVQDIATYYARRAALNEERIHDPLTTCNALWRSELQFETSRLLHSWLGDSRALGDCVIAEVGCGSGGNLLEMIRLGADPKIIQANDLMPHLVEQARHRLPQGVSFHTGDAMTWNLEPCSMDLVMQYTVFSSINSLEMRRSIAQKMWSWLKPNGAILSYDFTFNNPRNPNVSKLTLSQLRSIFPQHRSFKAARVTLAPPIARRVAPVSPGLFRTLNALPLLRTHAVCLIVK